MYVRGMVILIVKRERQMRTREQVEVRELWKRDEGDIKKRGRGGGRNE